MTFYWAANINTWNEHDSNELVQTRKFNVVVVMTHKRCHAIT